MKKEFQKLNIAKNSAKNSTCHHRHGAVLVKGNRVINIVFNKNGFSKVANRYRMKRTKNPWFGTRHAEIQTLGAKNTKGCSVYVCRVNNYNDFVYSYPCGMCIAAMQAAGIKEVIYSISNKEFGTIDLRRV